MDISLQFATVFKAKDLVEDKIVAVKKVSLVVNSVIFLVLFYMKHLIIHHLSVVD